MVAMLTCEVVTLDVGEQDIIMVISVTVLKLVGGDDEQEGGGVLSQLVGYNGKWRERVSHLTQPHRRTETHHLRPGAHRGGGA